jgi:hypothetical protein
LSLKVDREQKRGERPEQLASILRKLKEAETRKVWVRRAGNEEEEKRSSR